MHRIVTSAVGVLVLLAAAASGAMGRMEQHHGMRGMNDTSLVRHRYAMRHGIGAEYASRTNPLAWTEQNVRAGRVLYERTCAACHGPDGRGDGPAAPSLDPPPTDLAALAGMRMATDGYLYWSIAEGGVPLGTGMPAFEGSLEEREIWQLILYLRSMR